MSKVFASYKCPDSLLLWSKQILLRRPNKKAYTIIQKKKVFYDYEINCRLPSNILMYFITYYKHRFNIKIANLSFKVATVNSFLKVLQIFALILLTKIPKKLAAKCSIIALCNFKYLRNDIMIPYFLVN